MPGIDGALPKFRPVEGDMQHPTHGVGSRLGRQHVDPGGHFLSIGPLYQSRQMDVDDEGLQLGEAGLRTDDRLAQRLIARAK